MRDSVPSARYPAIYNVLRQWKTSLIPTYRVYRLYDTYATPGHGLVSVHDTMTLLHIPKHDWTHYVVKIYHLYRPHMLIHLATVHTL